MKRLVKAAGVGLWVLAAVPGFAHDEGHGPKISDAGRQGGVVASVVDRKESKKGAQAAAVYKAELTRTEGGVARVYLYDKKMKPMPLEAFAASAKGVLLWEKKGQFAKAPFALERSEGAYVGTLPKPAVRPFNMEVTFQEGSRELLVAFENVD